MALHEQHNERNQREWRSRLERERQDLSASVEAALVDSGVLQWQDESDEQEHPEPTLSGTALVPPRISLQSRMLPAVRSDTSVESATHSMVPSDTYNNGTEIGQKPSSQNTGVLARLAQRFTSSFAAIGGSKKSRSQIDSSTPLEATTSTQDTGGYLAPVSDRQNNRIIESSDTPLVIDTVPSVDSVVEATGREKPRSLKRNAKVRLETTEMQALAKTTLEVREQDTGDAMFSSDIREALDKQQESFTAGPQKDENARLSVLEMFNGELGSAARGTLSGAGVFDNGQGDVTISNARITAASVVLVTLTTNPGPVVVQYISLQPKIGFTVHLTAPVTSRTSFNYVVLLGELF